MREGEENQSAGTVRFAKTARSARIADMGNSKPTASCAVTVGMESYVRIAKFAILASTGSPNIIAKYARKGASIRGTRRIDGHHKTTSTLVIRLTSTP